MASGVFGEGARQPDVGISGFSGGFKVPMSAALGFQM
jgi:hypothetical protein